LRCDGPKGAQNVGALRSPAEGPELETPWKKRPEVFAREQMDGIKGKRTSWGTESS